MMTSSLATSQNQATTKKFEIRLRVTLFPPLKSPEICFGFNTFPIFKCSTFVEFLSIFFSAE